MDADKSLDDLEREITCSICQEHYTQPKVLPCCHYYCKKCILDLSLSTSPDQPLSCPECCKEATLPQDNVDSLPNAYFVNRLKATFETLERAHGRVDVKCDLCTALNAKAEYFCRQCAEFICIKCAESHQRMKTFSGHEVVTLLQLKEGIANQIVPKEPPTNKCLVHQEPLMMFCFDCSSLMCHYCTLQDHRDHNCDFCNVAAPKVKKELMPKLELLQEMKHNLSNTLEEIHTAKLETVTHGDTVANSIRTSFQDLQQILETRMQQLLEETEIRVREKVENLSRQEESVSIASTTVQSVVDYSEQCVNHCADNELMCLHTEIKNRMESVIEDNGRSGRTLGLVEEVDYGVDISCSMALQQLCQTEASLQQLPIDPSKCAVVGDGVRTAELGKPSDVILTAKLSNNRPTARSVTISGYFQSMVSGSLINCSISRIRNSDYCVQYTPTIRGRHRLTVSVDGQQVCGSPFSVFVSIPPAELHVSKVWCGLDWPLGIIANSVGEIVVAEGRKDVIVIDRNGKRLSSIQLLEHQFRLLSGVAVDSQDNIYIIDLKTNLIYKSSNSSSSVEVHEVQQVKHCGHVGVAVVGDEVMVCEYDNEGCITVYDKELNYVRHIVGRDMGTLVAISPDCHGNLYAIDCTNTCIQVFSNDGTFVRSFGCDLTGANKLNQPLGVCVSGQHVYVTDIGNDNVSVFTTEGEYVTSFGQHGFKIGDFSCPGGVCVDQDGFVYVCDCGNNRIQIF